MLKASGNTRAVIIRVNARLPINPRGRVRTPTRSSVLERHSANYAIQRELGWLHGGCGACRERRRLRAAPQDQGEGGGAAADAKITRWSPCTMGHGYPLQEFGWFRRRGSACARAHAIGRTARPVALLRRERIPARPQRGDVSRADAAGVAREAMSPFTSSAISRRDRSRPTGSSATCGRTSRR
jgi:hypothetical protein